MNSISENITRAKKVLGHIFTGKLLKQSVNNSNYASMNRTIDDYANIRDGLVHLTNCGFVTSKIPKKSEFLILESSADEGGELYALAITNKKPKIDDLADGDIRQWNPNANTQDENDEDIINTAYIDIKADGSLEIHKNNGKIQVKASGDISMKNGNSEILMQSSGITIKSDTSGGQIKLEPSGKVAIGKSGVEVVDLIKQIATALSSTLSTSPGSPISNAGTFSTIATLADQIKTSL